MVLPKECFLIKHSVRWHIHRDKEVRMGVKM